MRYAMLFLSLVLFSTGFFCPFSIAQEAAPETPAALKRADLEVPEALWKAVLDQVGYGGRNLGYTGEEMSHYGSDTHCLPIVKNLFKNVRAVPRLSGRVGDILLRDPADFETAAVLTFSLLDARAGRGLSAPEPETWGVNWLHKGISPAEAMQIILHRAAKDDLPAMGEAEKATLMTLPPMALRLAVRLIVAAQASGPLLRRAFDIDFLKKAIGEEVATKSVSETYDFLAYPWAGDGDWPERKHFEALDQIDLNFLALASVAYAKHVKFAIEECRKGWDPQKIEIPEFDTIRFHTEIGPILICGSGANIIDTANAIVIDLGGNDEYGKGTAVPLSLNNPISTVVDLSGNDKYEGGDDPASVACGLLGIGGLFDLAGDDTYAHRECGLGAAMYGTGFLVDFAGNDTYMTRYAWGQGAGHAGAGIFIDLAGNDTYTCATESQGFGSTLGAGVLVDAAGNDQYVALPDGRISKPFHNNTVSFAQGTAFGRRADFGDGHSLAGGVGVLVDGAGDDQYSGGVYCQGAAYWWALGLFEDRGGDDTYSNVWYSLGSAPHFAIGCCVDFSGNDQYNVGNEKLVSQTQGCARDASMAVFIDGGGDDHYSHRNRCGGAADLNSIALFWDRSGDDRYESDRNFPYKQDHSWGGSAVYPPFRTYRDDLATVGVFLDTGGKDTYLDKRPEGANDADFPPLLAAQDSLWRHKQEVRFRAVGIDLDIPRTEGGAFEQAPLKGLLAKLLEKK